MHKRLRRLLAAGSAVLVSMLTLAAPAAAAAEEAALSDVNGDGVIDVFDYVMNKRVTVAENSPVDLYVSSVEGYAGETVTVSAAVRNNPGFSFAKVAVQYGTGLLPVIPEGASEYTRVNKETFPKLNLSAILMEDYDLIICCSNHSAFTDAEGTLFDISFRIPEDALPGTVYQLGFQDIELSHKGQKLPMLTERGKITVLPPGTPKTEPVPPAVTTEVPAATTAPAKTTVTAGTTTKAATGTAPVSSATVTAAVTTAATTASGAAKTTAPGTTRTTAPVQTTAARTSKPFVITGTTTTTIVTTTVRPYLRHGIDISFWQGDNVDFEQVKTDPKAQFVILRAGFGKYLKQVDTTFYANYDRATKAGIPVGAYWYSYAKTPEEARIEANVCAQVLGDRKFDYPIAFDIEEKDVLAMDIKDISAIIEAFCSEMEKKGFFSQIYCSSFYLNHKINQEVKSRYDVWVANYNVPVPSFTGAYGMWQYGTGTVAGFKDPVDVDYCYRDYPAAMRRAKLNGYK